MFNDDRAGTLVVVTSLDSEYDAMRQHLVNVHPRVHQMGTLFETGELAGSGTRVALVQVAEGNLAAAALTERAITEFKPTAVIVVGIARAISAELGLGDVVVGTKIYAIHGGKDGVEGFRARPESFHADHALLGLARMVR